ncbi:hypothetical protein BDQ94DRAFT_182351 [Aspergillus welwitschiae]|uniref:Fungal-type protein kinase domain-containing protein n=1 Tax=Aspergillus welwitschiae TaxID=1341132 RepID=A0A3F3PRG6_9EURO|nr:hypothetical protein BDQ94DRAFT_182351 [Aspergillus welwitschiae]RDH29332.1 hypothetical protein BDQ94DRAFT_182351 [Aspergillus welwitschiae]
MKKFLFEYRQTTVTRNEGGSLHHHQEATYQLPQLAGPPLLGKRPAMKTCLNMAAGDRVKRGEESIFQDAMNKDYFVARFHSICEETGLSCTTDALNNLPWKDIQSLTLQFLLVLEHSAICDLTTRYSRATALNDIHKLKSAVLSETIDPSRLRPLLTSAIACTPDSDVWECLHGAVPGYTTPRREIASPSQQTPWSYNTSSLANSSEFRQDIDRVLKAELGALYVGLPHFHSTFFGGVSGLQAASHAVFTICTEGKDALFTADGWKYWPKVAKQEDVLTCFADITEKLAELSKDYRPESAQLRRPVAQPNKPVQGSTAERKLDIGFVSDINAGKDTRCQWSDILVPGELKRNPAADTASKAWLDLGRIWAFDRLGGVASEQFDINKDGLQFVFIILGFLWMSDEQYGFDPTIIMKEDGRRCIEIEQGGQVQLLVLKRLMKREPCIAGRATTCWEAYCENEPGVPLVRLPIPGVINVARHYYHNTACVRGKTDDIQDNVRGGLDIRTASNFCLERLAPPSADTSVADTSRESRSTGRPGVKRTPSQTDASIPPSKRVRSSKAPGSPHKLPNRAHRRIVLRDYGEPIYKASTHESLLAALEGCIAGHQSLHEVGILHRDISASKLMVNEDVNNPSWPAFLIDLDLAIREERDDASGANSKTGPGKGRVVARFDKWRFADTSDLAFLKQGFVLKEANFLRMADEYFTQYYKALIPCVNALRKAVFPNGIAWTVDNIGLYDQMKEILRTVREDGNKMLKYINCLRETKGWLD